MASQNVKRNAFGARRIGVYKLHGKIIPAGGFMEYKLSTAPPSKFVYALTELWQNQTISRESEASLLRQFDHQDWLLLACFDSVCLWGPDRGSVIVNEDRAIVQGIDGFVKRTIHIFNESEKSNACIKYPEFNKTFWIEGVAEKIVQLDRDPILLLELLSYLHFHIDGIVILPPDLRHRRLVAISNHYKFSVKCILNIVSWLSAIK